MQQAPVEATAPVLVQPNPINLRLNRMVTDRVGHLRRPPRGRGFHPSSLHRLCPVFHYYETTARDRLSVIPAESYQFMLTCADANTRKFSGALKLEFAVGDAIHQLVQYQLGAAGVLWGKWACASCGAKVGPSWMPRVTMQGVGDQPVYDGAPCVQCNGRNRRSKQSWIYLEPSIKDEKWGVNGKCDGDLRVTRKDVTYRCALEIKSINEYGWGEGKRKSWADIALAEGWTPPEGWVPEAPSKPLPKDEHVTQASIYAHLLGVPFVYFVYVNKNQVSKWKERMVPVDQAAVGKAVQTMTSANRGLELGQPPLEARLCPDIREDTARECPACELCWGKAPAANFWSDEEALRAP